MQPKMHRKETDRRKEKQTKGDMERTFSGLVTFGANCRVSGENGLC